MTNRPGNARKKAPSGAKKGQKRRRMLVDTPFQVRLLKPLLVGGVIFSAMAAVVVFFPLYQEAALDPSPMAQALLREQLLSVQARLWPLLLLAGLLASLYSLAGSNRLANPIFLLRQTLTQMALGEFPKVLFRRNDELHEFEGIINRLSERVEQLSSSSERKLTRVERHVKFMKERLEARELSKKEIMDDLDELLDQVGQVQVGDEASERGEVTA